MVELAPFLSSDRVGRILVPVDFSPKVGLTLPRAIALAKLSRSSIWLLHVIDAVTCIGMGGNVAGALPELHSRCSGALEELAESIRKEGVECTCLLREGDLDGRIREAIEANGIDMLVLSTRAGTGMNGFSIVSAAERILRKTRIPVLTLGACRKLRSWSADGCVHVFYATDLSPESVRSLQYARAIQHRFCAHFTVAHVLPKHASEEKCRKAMERLTELLENPDDKAVVLRGAVGEAICEGSVKAGADLVALGVQRHSIVREVLIGHHLREILSGAPCAVMSILQ
jgi:nucleotide-binding universal stress UspA family protein